MMALPSVVRLMRSKGLYALGTRRRYRHYYKKTNNVERPNLLNQVFAADIRNKIWLGDITSIPTKEGFFYLAAILDVSSRKAVGWSMESRMS